MNNQKLDQYYVQIRTTQQRVSRRDYIDHLPVLLRSEIQGCEYLVTPERDVMIMDLIDKFNTRTVLTKEYNTKEEVYRFIKSFKRIPARLEVYVWSSFKYGPVYKMNLNWLINNFEFLWNEENNFDLNIISENGKIGLMVSKQYEYEDQNSMNYGEYYIVKKWGLM